MPDGTTWLWPDTNHFLPSKVTGRRQLGSVSDGVTSGNCFAVGAGALQQGRQRRQ